MKHMRMYLSYLAAAVLAAGFLAMSGCEEDPSTDVDDIGSNTTSSTLGDRSNPSTRENDLTVTPESATVSKVGATQIFEVKGGDAPFTWTVSSATRGTIAAVAGNSRQAIYTCVLVGQNNVNVRDENGKMGSATIGGSTSSIKVQPSIALLTNTLTAVNLVASGGTGAYTWSVALPGLGSVTSATGSTTTYNANVAKPEGTQTVTVSDDENNSASCSVIQDW